MRKLLELTDEEVVEYVREKDKEAYGEIIKRYQDKLIRYATYILNDDKKAVDVVQDAFISGYVNLNGFNTNQKFSSWIYRIVHNQAINVSKKYNKELPILDGLEFDSGTDIEEDLDKKELVKMVNGCLLEIPVMYREVLSLFYLEDKTYSEISDILRIPIGTVGTRINRGKAFMKKICQKK